MLIPIWAQDGKYPASYDRLQSACAMSTGVIGRTHCKVRQRNQGASMSVDVAAGMVGVPDGMGGMYLCISDAIENRPVAAAPAAGTTRIDRVVVQVEDGYATGSGTHLTWDYRVLTGTPASSNPQPPPTPASAYTLAEIVVPSGKVSIVDADISDWRDMAIPIASSPYAKSIMTVQKSTPPGSWWGVGTLVLPIFGPHIISAIWNPVCAVQGGSGMGLVMRVYVPSSVSGGPQVQWSPEVSFGSSVNDWPPVCVPFVTGVFGDGAVSVEAYCASVGSSAGTDCRAARLAVIASPCSIEDAVTAWTVPA